MTVTHTRPRLGASSLILAGAAGIAVAVAPDSHAQIAADRKLSSADISGEPGCAALRIEFNTSMQYQSHFPGTGGQQLQIQVRPLTGAAGDGSRFEETLRAPRSDLVDIQSIRYDADSPASPALTIDFAQTVNWKVEQGGDYTSILIHISQPGIAGCDTAPTAAAPAPAATADGLAEDNPILLVTDKVAPSFDVSGAYTLDLDASNSGVPKLRARGNPVFDQYTAYNFETAEDGKSWNRLRVGFFTSRHDADLARNELSGAYPDASIERATDQERDAIHQAWLAARDQQARERSAGTDDPEARATLTEARAALDKGDPATAVRLAQAIVGRPHSQVTPEAQEVLGLARERAGQLAHAKAEYEIYLERYPDGEAANRIRLRLAVLLNGGEAPQDTLPEMADEPEGDGKLQTRVNGSVSALYQRDESALRFEDTPIVGGEEVNPDPIEEDRVNLNEMIYAADVAASVGNDRYEGEFRFSGLHRDDLRSEDPYDQSSISSLYLSLSDEKLGATARIGRQTRNTGGVFGRFDGVHASIQATDWLRLNAVAGSPVMRSRNLFIESDRQFYGASADVTMFDEKLETTAYFLNQTYGDLVDRQAAGFEFRYFDPKYSAFGIVDYDVHYGELNLALLSATRRFEDNSSINVAVDHRRSPLLTSFNAIIGQGVEDPNDLLVDFTEEDIYELALDRSATSTSAIVNYSRPLTDNLQINFDVTATEVSATEESGGVIAFPGSGPDFYYSTQLVASDLFKRGTIAVAGVRYADLQDSEQYSVLLNARYPLTKDIRLSPRLRFDQRVRRDGSSEDTSFRSSLRATWDMNRTLHWEAEAGGEWADGTDDFGNMREDGYFVNFGLRVDF